MAAGAERDAEVACEAAHVEALAAAQRNMCHSCLPLSLCPSNTRSRLGVGADHLGRKADALVPGVGKKTAERLLIELRGKLQLPVLDAMVDGKSVGTSVMTDVREALTGLGYSSEEIREVLRDLSATDSAENVLRQALNALGVRRA